MSVKFPKNPMGGKVPSKFIVLYEWFDSYFPFTNVFLKLVVTEMDLRLVAS